MTEYSLPKRIGIPPKKPIENDFPSSARTALCYLLVDLHDKSYLDPTEIVIRELNRIGRFTKTDLPEPESKSLINQFSIRIHKLEWYKVCFFCERLYSKYLRGVGDDFDEYHITLAEARQYYSEELNLILEEDYLSYIFADGQFQRKGRAQTQKAIERANSVLTDPKLEKVKNYYNKAIKFFNTFPNPDPENCVKEALCALESCVEILTQKNASKEFDRVLRQLQGNNQNQIPSPICESMIKVHGYRGSGKGVSHASLQGNRVDMTDAELILSLVASYITYLVDIFHASEEIPF
jgi:hypothetical protein